VGRALSVAQQAHTKQQQQNGKSKQKPITKKQEQKKQHNINSA